MSRRPVNPTRRLVGNGGFPLVGAFPSKTRSSPLVSVTLVALVLLWPYSSCFTISVYLHQINISFIVYNHTLLSTYHIIVCICFCLDKKIYWYVYLKILLLILLFFSFSCRVYFLLLGTYTVARVRLSCILLFISQLFPFMATIWSYWPKYPIAIDFFFFF